MNESSMHRWSLVFALATVVTMRIKNMLLINSEPNNLHFNEPVN